MFNEDTSLDSSEAGAPDVSGGARRMLKKRGHGATTTISKGHNSSFARNGGSPLFRKYSKAFLTSLDDSATSMSDTQVEALYSTFQFLVYQVHITYTRYI
jgi:hypothetical protein